VCALHRQVPALYALIGDPELQQPKFMDPLERIKDDTELGQKVQAWFAPRSKAELVELGAKHKVPIGAVMTPLDLLSNASLLERDFFDEVDTPAGRARVPGRLFLGIDWRAGPLAAPAADTEAVLRDWLGGAR
jgi:crotonobetainyl-CoA:carnitine CoA-transferase CaiB-like acyl-CoA transferase